MRRQVSFLLLAAAVFAQAPLSFDVASVKLSSPNSRGNSYSINRTGVSAENGTLKGLIEMAYEVREFQIFGGPGWIGADHFDIVTKVSAEDEKTMPASGPERTKQMRVRLRAVLADRFQLRIHNETREQPEYSLVVAKQGSKMKEDDPAQSPAGINSSCGVMKGTRTRMANLSIALSRQLERPVLDHTNLTGIYDFEMTYAPENGCGSRQPDSAAAAVPALDLPSLFTAIQEQLGLKLEPTKGPVEVIIIDNAEKPEPN